MMRGNPRFRRMLGVVVAVITVGSVNVASASAADRYVSTTGSDSGSCTAAAPCKSLGRAYVVASPGQVVEVAAGTYGGQTIGYDASKTSEADVVIQAAPGTRPVLGGLSVYGRHVTVSGLKTGW